MLTFSEEYTMAESVGTKSSTIQLDSSKLLLLGGTLKLGLSNPRMIGEKWQVRRDEE